MIVRYPHVHFDQSCFGKAHVYNVHYFTISWRSKESNGLFRRPQGMYFSAKDKGEMMSMIYNCPGHQVDMIVLTDGSRILGLGDLGVQGIGIPIGKLVMYVTAAGISPQRILTMLDVDHSTLLLHVSYAEKNLGLWQPWLEGEEYLSIVDEFMEAIHTCWPKAIVQFEDFQMKWSFERLQQYQKKVRKEYNKAMYFKIVKGDYYNDIFVAYHHVVWGTAAVALAGLLGTVRAQDRPLTDFAKDSCSWSWKGGLGVLNMAAQAVSRMAGAEGLITTKSKGVDPAAAPFAKAPGEIEGLGLRVGANLVKVVKKSSLMYFLVCLESAVSSMSRALSTKMAECMLFLSLVKLLSSLINQVLKAMRESDSPKPAIFSMSNPAMNAECTAVDAFNHAGENIVFASGSPFKNVDLVKGMEVGHVNQANQANNMYLFPGIKMGTLLSGAHLISDGMSQAASECIQDITAEVGAAIVRAAVAEELAEGRCDVGPRELRRRRWNMSNATCGFQFTALLFMRNKRYAVVTGANRGILLEICRQLASNGVMMVLTARDEKKGIEALEKLKENGLSDLVVFHQLDVLDPSTIASLADFIKTQFGRLDILVNNAAIGAVTVDTEALKASAGVGLQYLLLLLPFIQVLLPLLLLFDSPRIVNVSSTAGKLQYVSGEWDVGLPSDAENLSEDKVDEILTEFMKDFKEDQLEAKNWPTYLSAYILSKAAMNAYMRILAKTHPFSMINYVWPCYVSRCAHPRVDTLMLHSFGPFGEPKTCPRSWCKRKPRPKAWCKIAHGMP
ncbi:unnamed protein product [Camellia sinensis]